MSANGKAQASVAAARPSLDDSINFKTPVRFDLGGFQPHLDENGLLTFLAPSVPMPKVVLTNEVAEMIGSEAMFSEIEEKTRIMIHNELIIRFMRDRIR